jgi:outer membrane PBP1 activator LpoA protein
MHGYPLIASLLCAPFNRAIIKFSLLFVAALYVSPLAHATETPPAAKTTPHIALLLPLKSETFNDAADAVRQGFMAAASGVQALPIRIYESSDEATEVAALYRKAVANGARAVAGPLTRSGVAALAASGSITVPTLALNIVDAAKSPEQLRFFGLPAEAEAREVAQLAAFNKLQHAILISDGKPLSRRLTQAFAEEWKALGGNLIGEMRYEGDTSRFAELPALAGNMVFLAMDGEEAHLVRPYLNMDLPVYATSQVFNGNADTLANFDLRDVHFVDMPWMTEPDHPAVMVYAHPESLAPEMQRLYALGIDAFRIIQVMLNNKYRTALPLDGVTGRINLNAKGQFLREASPAVFYQGQGLTPEAAAALAAARAAAMAASAVSSVQPAPHQQP